MGTCILIVYGKHLWLLFPGGARGQETTCQYKGYKRCRFDPWVRKSPWRRKRQPTPAFLPRKFRGQRSLVGYSPWGREELDTTERLNTHAHSSLFFQTPLWCFRKQLQRERNRKGQTLIHSPQWPASPVTCSGELHTAPASASHATSVSFLSLCSPASSSSHSIPSKHHCPTAVSAVVLSACFSRQRPREKVHAPEAAFVGLCPSWEQLGAGFQGWGRLCPRGLWAPQVPWPRTTCGVSGGLDQRHWDNIDRKGIKMHALNFICCCCLVTQPCWTLLQPTGYSPPGSSVHGVFQARVLGGLPLPYSRGSSRLGAQTCISCLAGGFVTTQPPGKFHLESLTRPFVGIIKKRQWFMWVWGFRRNNSQSFCCYMCYFFLSNTKHAVTGLLSERIIFHLSKHSLNISCAPVTDPALCSALVVPWGSRGAGSALTQLTDEAMAQVRARGAEEEMRRLPEPRGLGGPARVRSAPAPSPREPRWPRGTGAQPSPGAGLAAGSQGPRGSKGKRGLRANHPLPAGRAPTALRLFSAALAGAARNQRPKTAAFFLTVLRGWAAEIRLPARLVSGGASLPGLWQPQICVCARALLRDPRGRQRGRSPAPSLFSLSVVCFTMLCQFLLHSKVNWPRVNPLEKEMATHSSILAWRISWTV